MPSAWPRKAKTAGSLNVIQCVTRSPRLDATSGGEVAEPAHDLRVREATAVLQRLRQVPVEQVDERLDARLEQGVDESLVEVDAALIDGARPRRAGRAASRC